MTDKPQDLGSQTDEFTDEQASGSQCEWCEGWEDAVVEAAVEYKTKGWDSERHNMGGVPQGYGFIGGPCEYCGRRLDFAQADAAYAEAVTDETTKHGSPADELRSLAESLGIGAGDREQRSVALPETVLAAVRNLLRAAQAQLEKVQGPLYDPPFIYVGRARQHLTDAERMLADPEAWRPTGIDELAEHWNRRPMM
jgi:hypothetical protein